MTVRLFYEDVYIEESDSKVIEKLERDGKLLVVLDKTPFYPEGGGQPSDFGTIGEAQVIYAFEEGEKLYHVVDRFPENEKAHCRIDFNRRFDHMQQHSGEHLLAATFCKFFDAVVQGFHLGDDYVSIDVNLPEITYEDVKRIEDIVNGYIYKNIPVNTFMVTPQESKNIKLRKTVEEKEIRVVQITEVDACACCGTHVKYTGEIGLFKIMKTEKYKGMTRVYFKCGRRALEEYRNKQEIITTLARSLSTGEGELINKINSDLENTKELNRKLGDYRKKLSVFEAENLKTMAKDNIIYHIFEDKEADEIQMIAEKLNEEDLFVILVSKRLGQIIVLKGGGYDINIGQFFKENIKTFNGKGGGSNKRAQGYFSSIEDIKAFAEELFRLYF